MLEWNFVEEWLSWTLALWKWDVKVTCPARKSTLLDSDKQTNFIQAMHIKEIIDAQSALLHCKHTWQWTVRTRFTKQKLKKTLIPACPLGYLHACLPLWFSWMKTFLGPCTSSKWVWKVTVKLDKSSFPGRPLWVF